MTVIFLIAGVLLLFKGASYFVSGSASIARRFGISTLIIGLTLVAFGTSFPEFMVSFTASLKGANDITIGNIVGSNIFNLLVILGISALLGVLPVRSSTVWHEIPFSLLAALALWIVINDPLFKNGVASQVSFSEGLLFILFFVIFVAYTISVAVRQKAETKTVRGEFVEEVTMIYIKSLPKALIATILGLIAITLGGILLVESSIEIAEFFGVSQALIGLTVATVGTSLPELATSIVAVYKKEADISVGNIVGSNIFNIFFVGGVSALPHVLTVDPRMSVDTVFLIIVTAIAFILIVTRKKVSRVEGGILLSLYALYLGYIFWRG